MSHAELEPHVSVRAWKDNYAKRPYAERNVSYDNYRPAYRTGYEGITRYPGNKFMQIEPAFLFQLCSCSI